MNLGVRRRLVAAGMCVACLTGWHLSAWGEGASATRKSAKTAPQSKELDANLSGDAKIIRKLEKILENQEAILANQQNIDKRFDAVMEELRIVKVRALINN